MHCQAACWQGLLATTLVIPFLGILMLIAGGLLALLPALPAAVGVLVLFPMVLLIALFTYGVRGIFWPRLMSAMSASTRGLAVGLITCSRTPRISMYRWCNPVP